MPPSSPPDSALVLFSGGQDSATALGWALDRFPRVETVGFAYGQRHHVELACRAPILAGMRAMRPEWDARLGPDQVLDLSLIGAVAETSLTREIAIELETGGLPNTFVPARNLLFFTAAAALAWRRDLKRLVGGMCETDYSGYPDCRDDTLKALQVALNLGMERRFVIETPLMWLTKAETWALADDLGGAALVDLIRDQSHSCYLGDREHVHDWGRGCGTCPACELHAAGWRGWREMRR